MLFCTYAQLQPSVALSPAKRLNVGGGLQRGMVVETVSPYPQRLGIAFV
jgi:hypothetical protein